MASTSLINTTQGMLSSMHTRQQGPPVGREQQWIIRVVNSLLSLSIRMTNHTSHTGIAVEIWATPKRQAVRGHSEPFKPPAISLTHPSPSIQTTTNISPITIPTTTTCSILPTHRAPGPEPSLMTLEALLEVCLSILPSTQPPINQEFPTLTPPQPR